MRKKYNRKSRLVCLQEALEYKTKGQSLRVLVVDDDPDILNILKHHFEKVLGWEADIANDAHEALLRIDCALMPFDGIFLDINMPETNGIELCEMIRRRADYGSTPIIMISGVNNQNMLRASIMAGANDFVAKPIDFDEVIVAFQRHKTAVFSSVGPSEMLPSSNVGQSISTRDRLEMAL